MTEDRWNAMTALAVVVVLAGLLFSWMLLRVGQFNHAVISFGLVVVLLVAIVFGRVGALRRISAKAFGSEVDVEFYEHQTRQAFIQAAADLPERDRAETLKRLHPLIRIIGFIRAELAALSVRLTATEEELAALKRQVGPGPKREPSQ